MTGRDLIIYILENNLEDVPIVQNGRLVGFLTIGEAAAKFEVGEATVTAWIACNLIDHVRIGYEGFIPANAEPKIQKEKRND